MIGLPANGNGAGIAFQRKRFDDTQGFEVCWAGPHPFQRGFCFGSTDGRLLLTDESGQVLGDLVQASVSSEAINGVSAIRGWVAVSTRAEITLDCVSPTQSRAVFPVGSHGVIATGSGYFVAPLGLSGLMVVKPQVGAANQSVNMITSSGGLAYFYRVISLPAGDGTEVIVCANRTGGLGAMRFTGAEDHPLNEIAYAGLDVVDVCALSRGKSLAVAAIGKDGTLVLSRDALHEKKPVTIKFEQMRGVAYRIHSARGHLFVLTSEAMYLMFGLAEKFVSGDDVTAALAPVAVLPMEALDANLYQDELLLLVMSDEIRAFAIGEARQDGAEIAALTEFRTAAPHVISPRWTEQELRHNNLLAKSLG